MKLQKGFTLIEILIIVSIIGLLAAIILVTWALSAQNRAAMAGYKTSMDSVRAAAEMCVISSGSIIPGSSGDSICDFGAFLGNEKYPQLNKKCQGLEFGIGVSDRTGGWMITTDNPCGECLLDCDIISCQPASGYETKCN